MTSDMVKAGFGLPRGNWRFDPFTRVQIWVPDDPTDMREDDTDPPLPKFEHGTEYGYRLHRRHDIAVCDPCREALNEAARRRRTNRRLNNEKDAA